jgi:hypothetical protein
MRVTEISIEESAGHPHRVSLRAVVQYKSRQLPSEETYSFEVETQLADQLSERGSPWLALLLPIAVTFNEPLELPVPVDRRQYEGAQQLMRTWLEWYPQMNLAKVPILADIDDSTTAGTRKAAFFSGGVDTFYTVLSDPEIDDLILIRGFDLPLQDDAVYDRVVGRLQEAASELGKQLVGIRVDFRETASRLVDIMRLSTGGNLSSVALALEKRWEAALISASLSRFSLHPSGSHPDTDGLYSTAGTEIVHYGWEATRYEKIQKIADNPVVRKYVRVCWVDSQGGNCGNCAKCYRSMIGFQLAGVLPEIETFEKTEISVEEIRRLYLPSARNWHYIEDLIHAARAQGEEALAEALEYSIKRSESINRWTRIQNVRAWAERLKHQHPFVYRMLLPIRRTLHFIATRLLGNLWT